MGPVQRSHSEVPWPGFFLGLPRALPNRRVIPKECVALPPCWASRPLGGEQGRQRREGMCSCHRSTSGKPRCLGRGRMLGADASTLRHKHWHKHWHVPYSLVNRWGEQRGERAGEGRGSPRSPILHLFQAHDGTLCRLPALPRSWSPAVSKAGLLARSPPFKAWLGRSCPAAWEGQPGKSLGAAQPSNAHGGGIACPQPPSCPLSQTLQHPEGSGGTAVHGWAL